MLAHECLGFRLSLPRRWSAPVRGSGDSQSRSQRGGAAFWRVTLLLWALAALSQGAWAADAPGGSPQLSAQGVIEEGSLISADDIEPLPLRFADGTALTLAPGSWLHLEEASFDATAPDSDRLVVRLVKGGLRAVTGRIGRRGDSGAFAARTPVGSIGIRGTEFQMVYCEVGQCTANWLHDVPDEVRPRLQGEGGLFYSVASGAVVLTNASGDHPLGAGRWGYVRSLSSVPIEGSMDRRTAGAHPLREVIIAAIHTHPEVQERWHAFRASESAREVARGRFFPEVDLGLSAERQYQESSDFGRLSRDPLEARLSLNQMLYDGFFTSADVKRLDHASRVRYYELLDAAEQVALLAVRAYADVGRYQEQLRLAEDNYSSHRNVYDQVLQLAESGVGRRVDLEQATGRLALAESGLLTELANLHDASARYLSVVGSPAPDEYTDMTGFIPAGVIPATVDEAVQAALSANPAIFASEDNLIAAQEQVRVGRSYYHPRVDFRAQVRRDNALNSIMTPGQEERWVTDSTIGLVLRLNLFRGWADQARIGQFTEEVGIAEDKRDGVCRNIRQTVAIAFNDLQVVRERLVYLDQYQLSSDQVRRAYQQQFEIGQRTLLDLLDIENEYFQARRAFVDALFDRELAAARTLAGVGQLLKSLEIVRDDMPEIGEDTALDPEELCPPLAPQPMKVERNSLFR